MPVRARGTGRVTQVTDDDGEVTIRPVYVRDVEALVADWHIRVLAGASAPKHVPRFGLALKRPFRTWLDGGVPRDTGGRDSAPQPELSAIFVQGA